MEKRLPAYVFLGFLLSNFFLVSCSNSSTSSESESSSTSSNSISSASGKTSTETLTSSDGVTVKKIVVSSRCIGCSHCVRIDPTHFKMNQSTHKAEAIQASGNDSALERAVDRCPADAISVS